MSKYSLILILLLCGCAESSQSRDVREYLIDCGGGHTDNNGIMWDWDCPRENYKCYEWGCQSLCKPEECKYFKRELP